MPDLRVRATADRSQIIERVTKIMDDAVLNEKIEKIIDEMTEGARHLGLYTQHAATLPTEQTPFGEHLTHHMRADDEARMALTMVFMLGDRAFEDSVQNPETARFKKEFDDLRPDTMEMFEQIKQDLKKELSERPSDSDPEPDAA